jgi:Protein of unknown function (DUF3987)
MALLTHAEIRKALNWNQGQMEGPCAGGCGHSHFQLFSTAGFKCQNGCNPARLSEIIRGLLDRGETYKPGAPAEPKKPNPSDMQDWKGFTLKEYCALKRLDPRLLEYLFGARTVMRRDNPVSAWIYSDETGKILATKLRLSASSHDTYFEPADPHVPYGLNNPQLKNMISRTYDLIIAEGETDTHTLASWGFPVIGISGSEGWLPEYAELAVVQNAARIFIDEHQDGGGKKFVAKILKDIPQALVLRPPQDMNDFNDLHLKHVDFEDYGFAPHPFIQSIDIAIQAATLEKAMRQPKPARPKPAPMRDEAFHGLAGRIVDLLAPVMETDEASILSNVLVCAGVFFQRSAFCKVLADIHYPVDYFLTVGNTAVARKGTTTNAVVEVLERVQSGFKDRILTGLSTGQGLITALIKKQPEGEEEETEVLSEPIAPAVLVGISEFAGLLAVLTRDDDILSAVLRDAWDGKPLAVLTRNQPLRVKNVSLATIAHITQSELLKKLTETERANGFANRFLFVWTERAQLLPRGKMDHINFSAVVAELHEAMSAAENFGEISRDEETEELWAEEYKRLTTRGDSMIDALLSRADAHVLRLSLLFALLDKSPVIRKVHLKAALAFWDYCEASVRYVFGTAADPADQRILRKLENGTLTTSEIRRQVFGDNKAAEWVSERMAGLEQLRRVRRCQKEFKTKTLEAWELIE